jgi:hypothetical protein
VCGVNPWRRCAPFFRRRSALGRAPGRARRSVFHLFMGHGQWQPRLPFQQISKIGMIYTIIPHLYRGDQFFAHNSSHPLSLRISNLCSLFTHQGLLESRVAIRMSYLCVLDYRLSAIPLTHFMVNGDCLRGNEAAADWTSGR